MTLHFDLEIHKPLEHMTEAELKAYAAECVKVHEEMNSFIRKIYTLYIQRQNERFDRERAAGLYEQYASVPVKKASRERSSAEWKRLMMETDDE